MHVCIAWAKLSHTCHDCWGCLQTVKKVAAHAMDVNAVAFADGSPNILISGSDDGLCKVRACFV